MSCWTMWLWLSTALASLASSTSLLPEADETTPVYPLLRPTQPTLERCLPDPEEEPKLFYYGDQALPVSILTTERVTHLLISSVVAIVAEEALGYRNVTLHAIKDPRKGFDPDAQFETISSCTDFRCQNLDRLEVNSLAPVPVAMVNMELWLPPNFQVEHWQVEDIGRLGPGGRFGWFIPERFARSTPPIKDHWRAFTTPEVAGLFAPSEDRLQFIRQQLRNKDGRFVCEEPFCAGQGMYIPSVCQSKRRHAQTAIKEHCALMITDFPVHSSIYSTDQVISQIERLGLLVSVAFVGERLMETVAAVDAEAEADADAGRNNSYLLFHYTPSAVTSSFNLTSVKFEPCDERWDESEEEEGVGGDGPDCLYNYNRFAKVIWPPLKEGAPTLYKTLRQMEFSPGNYEDLLRLYRQRVQAYSDPRDPALMRDVACSWLHTETELQNGHGRAVKTYERWSNIGKTKQKLRIAGIFPIKGGKFRAPELLPVAMMAKQDINANGSILANYELHLHISDGQCRADVVMKRFIEIITNRDYKSFVGILGPACSDTVEPIAGVSRHFRSVVITYSAEGSITSDGNESQYPYFFRTIAENRQYKFAYLEIFKKLSWSRVASLTLDGHEYSEYISLLQDVLQTHGVNFIMNRKFPKESPDMSLYLRDLRDRGARIIIGDFFERAARVILCEAHKHGMTQKHGYVWFLPGWYQHDWYDVDAIRARDGEDEFTPNCTTKQMIEAIEGHFSLIHATYARDDDVMQTGHRVGEWKDRLRQTLSDSHFDTNHPNKYSGNVYDAVWLYALALDRLIKQNKSYIQDIHSERSVGEFVKIIADTDFHGVTGRINYASGRNSRLSNVKIMQFYNNDSHVIGIYEPNYSDELNNGSSLRLGHLIEWNAHLIRWHTHDGTRPNDHAKECSILSNFATALDVECEHAIILAFVIGFGLLFCLLLLIFIVFKRRYERKMRQTEERMRALGLLTPTSLLTLDEWEIPRDRVVINRKLGEGAFGTVYGGEAFFDDKGWSKLERLWSVPSFKDIAMRTDCLDSNYLHKDGVLRVAVAVKTLKTGSTVEEKIDFLSEADMMKRFDHKNIVKLLGVCTRNEPIYTVMEFMLYGDLKTYLLARRHLVNERNREDQDEVSNRRLTSMALDVARGLSYLAGLKYVHRDVACRNCLVNSFRVVKLADFGMTRPMYENDYYRFNKKGMLPVRWMAPESLADGLFTPMSDVWSYGVLLYEIITFGSFPFQGLSNNQVLEHVKTGNTLAIPAGIKSQLETLLRSCWHKAPTKRPTAAEIVELLSNNPRLISPCIDVPLASVQVERTDSLEFIPSAFRKTSGSVSQKQPLMVYRSSGRRGGGGGGDKDSYKDNSAGGRVDLDAAAYSPMMGVPNGSLRIPYPSDSALREPLLPTLSADDRTAGDGGPADGGASRKSSVRRNASCSYVPPGYIVLDHRVGKDICELTPTSVSSF